MGSAARRTDHAARAAARADDPSPDARQRRSVRRSALIFGVIAVLIYLGFVAWGLFLARTT